MAVEPIQTPEDGTEVVPPVAPTPDQPSQPAAPIDYETKFKESQKEVDLLRQADDARKRTEQESTKQPTDSDLRSAFPDWDNLTDGEKADKRRIYNAERTAATALKTANDLQSERSWERTIEMTVISNSDLQGKEQAFRQYAMQPKYRGVPMELIVDAFLGKNATVPPAPKPTPKPGLETGNGGPRTPDKPQLLSAAELKQLRESDEKAYLVYIKTHDISSIE